MSDEIVIPDKPAFKAAEVCELLKLQPYVLRSWENEFKDLGVSKTPGGPRVYRRTDVQRAVRIRDLMLRDGLTLAGVRRRLEQETGATSAEDELIAEIATRGRGSAAPRGLDSDRVAQLKQGLRDLLETLSRPAPAGGPAAAASPEHPRGEPAARTAGAQPPAGRDATSASAGEPSLFEDEGAAGEAAISGSSKPRRKRPARGATPAPE